jgi:hypothetical protein
LDWVVRKMEYQAKEFNFGFNKRLIRFTLFIDRSGVKVLEMRIHHSLVDGWSSEKLW